VTRFMDLLTRRGGWGRRGGAFDGDPLPAALLAAVATGPIQCEKD
jgi:hypothetical protein